MITLQILNKLLQTGNAQLIINNNLDAKYFPFYEKEFNYINNHLQKYGNIPNKETFLSKFKDFQLFEVTESDEFLIEGLFEEYLYNLACPVAVKFAELLKTDANEATMYLLEQAPQLTLTKGNNGIDIIKNAKVRYQEHKDRCENPDKHFLTTGFEEIDAFTKGGWNCREELALFFARTEQGKTWVLLKVLEAAWRAKKRVGLISPEMSANLVGFRFDTEHSNFSNSDLLSGVEVKNYDKYIEELTKIDIPFNVSTPKNFNNRITIAKIRNYCKVNNFDILGIDGVGYLEDERLRRGEKRHEALAHISEDLVSLSIELGIPIIIVTHANRQTSNEEGPTLSNIKDSDSIANKATKIFSVRNDNGTLILDLKKNRHGKGHKEFKYNWNIDMGEFIYIDVDKKPDIKRKVDEEADATSVF